MQMLPHHLSSIRTACAAFAATCGIAALLFACLVGTPHATTPAFAESNSTGTDAAPNAASVIGHLNVPEWKTGEKDLLKDSGTSTKDAQVQTNSSSTTKTTWSLILVNRDNPLPDGYSFTLASLDEDHAVDVRCVDALKLMLVDCQAAGFAPKVCSSYRTQEMQNTLFADQIQELMQQGYSEEDATAAAASRVAVPGTSEHQAGLAVDLVDNNDQSLDATQEGTPTQQWLIANSWKYGFILRYPVDKSDLTGIVYEPWHYRYVGRAAALEIHEKGLCLEEYLQQTSAA